MDTQPQPPWFCLRANLAQSRQPPLAFGLSFCDQARRAAMVSLASTARTTSATRSAAQSSATSAVSFPGDSVSAVGAMHEMPPAAAGKEPVDINSAEMICRSTRDEQAERGAPRTAMMASATRSAAPTASSTTKGIAPPPELPRASSPTPVSQRNQWAQATAKHFVSAGLRPKSGHLVCS